MRSLSQNPEAERARERRLMAKVCKHEKAFNAEVKARIAEGMTFDEAWVAAGGLIILDNCDRSKG